MIALVITIVVLLILVGISISLTVGRNGVLAQASSSVIVNRSSKAREEVSMAWASVKTKYWTEWAQNSSKNLEDYLNKDLLNTYLVGTGRITEELSYDNEKEAYLVKYKANDQGQDYEFYVTLDGVVTGDAVLATSVEDNPVTPKSVQIKDANGTTQNVTKADVANWYGKEVKNYKAGATYRIFYIDFDGKYGDPGTIYLKADYSDSLKGTLSTSTPDSTTKVIDMNPGWAEGTTSSEPPTKRKDIALDSLNYNEKAAAYLCTPVTSTSGSSLPWASYYESGKSDFVIGSPSAEMYCDSYSQVTHTTGNYSFEAVYDYSSTPGYKYKYTDLSAETPTPAINTYTPNGSLDYSKKYNNMYCGVAGGKTGNWWLASPSSVSNGIVCNVNGGNAYLNSASYNTTYGFCPLVSLNSSFIPSLQTQS